MDPFGDAYRRPEPPWPPVTGLDPVGWFIATLHSLLGHDKAAAVLSVPAYDKRDCLICAYDRDPTPENKQAVYRTLAPRG